LRLAEILQAQAHPQFAFSLDGNEQFKSLALFQDYWETISAQPKLMEFFRHLLFVEQPVHREFALQPEAGEVLGKWPQRPPIIIDESDATLEDLRPPCVSVRRHESQKTAKEFSKAWRTVACWGTCGRPSLKDAT